MAAHGSSRVDSFGAERPRSPRPSDLVAHGAVDDDRLAVERDRAAPHRQVQVAGAVPTGHLVGARRVQEVAGERAQLGAVRVGLVVERERLPPARPVETPADVADGERVRLVPRGEVRREQLDVEAVARDVGDPVVRDRAGDGRADVLLNVRFTSPGARTRVPDTVPSAGNASTSPPGQCAMPPGSVTVPSDPARTDPSSVIVRSVPDGDVTVITDAASRRDR
jgi:hypothetical protein